MDYLQPLIEAARHWATVGAGQLHRFADTVALWATVGAGQFHRFADTVALWLKPIGAGLLDSYHDVLLFILQLAIFGPVVAIFVEVFSRKDSRDARKRLLLDLNYQMYEMICRPTLAFIALQFVKTYDMELLSPPIREAAELIEMVERHNERVARAGEIDESALDIAVHWFQTASRLAGSVQVGLNSPLFETAHPETVLKLGEQVRVFSFVAMDTANFLSAAKRHIAREYPNTVNYDVLFEHWLDYMGETISRKPKGMREQVANLISRLLYRQELFQLLTPEEVAGVRKIYEELKGTHLPAADAQERTLAALKGLDLRRYQNAHIDLSLVAARRLLSQAPSNPTLGVRT
jgi:hypothetical protein